MGMLTILDTTASAPSDDEDDDEVMEAEPQRDAGGSSPTLPTERTPDLSHNQSRDDRLFVGSTATSSLQDTRCQIKTYDHPKEKSYHNTAEKLEDSLAANDNDWELVNSKLTCLRRYLLDELIGYLPKLRDVGT